VDESKHVLIALQNKGIIRSHLNRHAGIIEMTIEKEDRFLPGSEIQCR
jgi:hypothetical protein